VVPADHRLALIVGGTDRDLIDPPPSTPRLTLDLARTAAKLPIVGGAPAFARATAGSATVISPRESRLGGVAEPRPIRPIPGGSPR
jgi:X-Pro dipeptidyl-peptidase